MIVQYIEKEVNVHSVPQGKCFLYEDNIWMACNGKGGKVRSVRLKDGLLKMLRPMTVVVPLEQKTPANFKTKQLW